METNVSKINYQNTPMNDTDKELEKATGLNFNTKYTEKVGNRTLDIILATDQFKHRIQIHRITNDKESLVGLRKYDYNLKKDVYTDVYQGNKLRYSLDELYKYREPCFSSGRMKLVPNEFIDYGRKEYKALTKMMAKSIHKTDIYKEVDKLEKTKRLSEKAKKQEEEQTQQQREKALKKQKQEEIKSNKTKFGETGFFSKIIETMSGRK